MGKYICGPCVKPFENEEAYLAHQCSAADGAKPTEAAYLIKTTHPNFAKVSEAALKRGAEKAEAKEAKVVEQVEEKKA